MAHETLLNKQLVTYLASLGLGTAGQDLFVATLPSTPSLCTAVIPSGGIHDGSAPTKSKTFRILHRNPNDLNGFSAISSLFAAIDNDWCTMPNFRARLHGLTEPGPRYEEEESGLYVWFANFACTYTKVR